MNSQEPTARPRKKRHEKQDLGPPTSAGSLGIHRCTLSNYMDCGWQKQPRLFQKKRSARIWRSPVFEKWIRDEQFDEHHCHSLLTVTQQCCHKEYHASEKLALWGK
ncbi:hypothetical protein CEXT_29291 [Caerostris extrusa]|uniref:Uncharacterized protein n=1 Tax=Caerostris extrusa TaxID=172846 RepID=A0AAV4QD90_CAEEX|nr:hypothetical protein CEXT_29291 [Caerostris extrusa]